MAELTAEQKAREIITGSPMQDPYYQHEGEDVVRWVTGGTLPDVYITLHQEDGQIAVRCATCKNVIGHLPTDFERGEVAKALQNIRLSGHEHR